jgi:anti-sigma B factor antagonist
VVLTDERLQIDVRHERDRVVIGLHGELDLLGAPALQSEIENPEMEATETVVLDLRDLRFVDSAGLRVILAAHGRRSLSVAARRRFSVC